MRFVSIPDDDDIEREGEDEELLIEEGIFLVKIQEIVDLVGGGGDRAENRESIQIK